MALRTAVFDDFAPGGSAGLGVNEMIPLVSQACLGLRRNCHHRECRNTRSLCRAHQDLSRSCMVASQQNPPLASGHLLLGRTQDSHVKCEQCPITARAAPQGEVGEAAPRVLCVTSGWLWLSVICFSTTQCTPCVKNVSARSSSATPWIPG